MAEFNSVDQCNYYCGQESLRWNGVAIIVNKRVQNDSSKALSKHQGVGGGPHSVCGVRFSLNLNKSTTALSLCLSLNSFCNETARTWALLGPENMGCGWVWVPAMWVQVSSWILAGIKSQHVGSSPKLRNSFTSICGFDIGKRTQLSNWTELNWRGPITCWHYLM